MTILHTADVHGNIAGRRDSGGGLLRCATLVSKIRTREKNVLLVDCGDFIQGTAESFLSQGRIMMDAAAAMQYDALVPGNHEFDWGVANLRRLYASAGIPVVACNIIPREQGDPEPFIIREMEGVRVAVIGLTTPNIPNWSRPRLIAGLEFIRSVPALRKTMPLVRAREPDIIVVAAHQGHRRWGGDNRANEINAVAAAFPDIDLIIGGHIHQEVVMRDVHGVPYTQAGCYALCLGKVSLTFDRERGGLIGMEFELLRADESVEPDPELSARFADELEQAAGYLNRIVGSAATLHSSSSGFPGQSATQSLIAAAIAESVGADIVIHRALTDYELRSGSIAVRDVWGIVPYENYIGIAGLTADDIVEILEENSRFFETREFRGVHGLSYELHPDQPDGERVRGLRLACGRKPAPGERLRTAFNSYDMASAGGRLRRLREIIERPESDLDETRIDTRDAVVQYLERHSPIDMRVSAGAVVVRP